MSDYKYEFPDFDYGLIVPKGWKDCSWHNDTCPNIEKEAENRGAMIFEDYADESLREVDGGKQFILYLAEDLDNDSVYMVSQYDSESDSFEELLAKAEAFLRGEEK